MIPPHSVSFMCFFSLSLIAHSPFPAFMLGACQHQEEWPDELSGTCPAASLGCPAVPKGSVTEEAVSRGSWVPDPVREVRGREGHGGRYLQTLGPLLPSWSIWSSGSLE